MPKIASAAGFGPTNSDLAKQVGADLGMAPDPDQCEILDAIYRVRPDDPAIPEFFEVAIVAPRQNIKTSTLEIAALTDLFVLREPMHIWTAQLYDTSTQAFRHMSGLIESNPKYQKLCKWPPRSAHGDQAIELLTGEQISFRSRSKKSGRGYAGVAKITFDEALFLDAEDLGAIVPTSAVIPGAQLRYGSSAGLEQSAALRAIRNRGRPGSKGLAYFEWYAEQRPCESDDCDHHVGSEGCVLDDPAMLAEANPALGRRISLERLQQFRRAMPPAEYAREFLSWWDEGPDEAGHWSVITETAWAEILDPCSESDGQVAFSVDVTMSRSAGSISVAGLRSDGLKHVELADARPGTEWIVDRVVEMDSKWAPVAWAIDEGGPAGTLIGDIERAGVVVTRMNMRQVAQSANAFLDAAVHSKSIRHRGQGPLDAAVAGASKRPLGDTWAWGRKDPDVNVAPLVSGSNALWGLNQHLDGGGLSPDDVYVGKF